MEKHEATMQESQTEALWRRLLREGELVFIGHCTPDQAFVEEKPGEETMVEFFLRNKPNASDKRMKKLRISISIVKPPPPKDDD